MRVIAATALPLWVTILVSIAGGGVLGVLATVTHERGNEMRSRMLAAADDHLQIGWGLTYTSNLMSLLLSEPTRIEAERLEKSIRDLLDIVQHLDASLARIYLLFGEKSTTWGWAVKVDRAADVLVSSLNDWRVEPTATRDVPEAYPKASNGFAVAMDNFGNAARREIRFGAIARWYWRARSWFRQHGGNPQAPDAPTPTSLR